MENETDGRDETLLLSGFEPSGFGSGERVRDDEIAQLIALTPADQTVFVADACHAGTLSRSVAPILGYRYYAAGELVDDPLPPPPPNTSPDEGRGELGLFLAAVDESAKVPEFLIDGKPRGALSHAFASALRGEADHDGDRQLTLGEIETFVRRSIRNISYGLQMPEITRGGGVADVLLALETGPRAAKASSEGNEADTGPDVEGAAPSIWQTPFASLPQPALATTGDAIDGLEGATIVSETRNADLVLNAQSGTLTSMVGDAVAEVPGSTASLLQPTIDKTRLSLALTDYAFDMDLDVVFLGGDRTYRKDDIVEVAVSGRTTRHLTLFNLSSTGKINYLYPVRDPAGGIMDPLETSPDSFTLPLTITPPFGAEHIVALETTTMADDIRSTIASYDGSTDIRGFWDQVRRAVDRQPGNVTIAIFPFHSADEGN